MDIPHDAPEHHVPERDHVTHDHSLPRFSRNPADPSPYSMDLSPQEKSIYNYLGGNLLAEVELNSASDDFSRKRRRSSNRLGGGASKRLTSTAGSSSATVPPLTPTATLDYNHNDPSNPSATDAANFFHQHSHHHHSHQQHLHHHHQPQNSSNSNANHHNATNNNTTSANSTSPKITPSSPSGSDNPSADADDNLLESSSATLTTSSSRFDILCSALDLDLGQKDRLLQLSSNIRTSAERDLVMIGLLLSSTGKVGGPKPTSSSSAPLGVWIPTKSTKDFIKSACRSFVTSSNVKGYGTYAGEAVMDYLTKQRHNVAGWPEGFINEPSDFMARRLLRDVVDKELIELRSQIKKELCRGMPKSSNSLGPTDPVPRELMPPIEKVAEMIDKLGQRRSDAKTLPILEPGTEEDMVQRTALLRTLVATCYSGRRGHFWRWADEVLEKLSAPTMTIEYRQAILDEVVAHDRAVYPKDSPKYFEEDGPSVLPNLLHDLTLKTSS